MIRVGINGFTATDYPFKNLAKLLQSRTAGTSAYPSILNSDGYPTSSPGTAITGIVQVPNTYAGQWLLKWSGVGALTLVRGVGGFTIVSGSGFITGSTSGGTITAAGTNARIVFTMDGTPSSSMNWSFPAGTYTAMAGLVLCRIADEGAIDAGVLSEQFDQTFLDKVLALKPAYVRTLDMSGANGNTCSRYAHMAQVSNLSYQLPLWLPNLWAGIASGTDTYACGAATDTPGTFTNGETIQLQFTNASTSTTPTIDVGGRGAKTITNAYGTALTVAQITANKLATLVYEDSIGTGVWLYNSNGHTAGSPLAICAALANKLGVPLWYNLPHLMNDAGVTLIANYVRDNLVPAWWPELSNETWNFSFQQNGVWSARGAALGFSASNNRRFYGYHGLRHRQVMGLITTAWASRATGLVRIMGAQAAGTPSVFQTYQFNGSDLGSFGFDTAPNRPKDFAEGYAVAPYINGAVLRDADGNYNTTDLSTLTAAADNYASGIAASRASALDWVDTDVRSGTRGGVLGGQTFTNQRDTSLPAWQTVAAADGKSFLMYEFAFQGIAPSSSRCTALGISTGYAASIATMLAAYKNDDRFRKLVYDSFSMHFTFAATTFSSWYVFGGGGQWSMRAGDLNSATFKSADAMTLFNDHKRRLVVKT